MKQTMRKKFTIALGILVLLVISASLPYPKAARP